MRLELDNVGINIDGRWLVRHVSLELRGGGLSALVGPNGSGKSTLLRLLGGLWKANEGAVTLDERNLKAMPRRAIARSIAYTPQDTRLDFAFTVREAVMMGRHPHLGRFEIEREIDRSAVDNAMRRADVAHLADRFVTELSGGERQRVLLARSLATEAPILLLDEPTASLDIAHALDALNLCRELAEEGKAIAIAIHDLNLAARFADQVALLDEGCLVACGATDEVLRVESLNRVFGVSADRIFTDDGKPVFVFNREV
ncbi:MAG: ABC transporter ATP-binding protein [Blastocatellia bacterium]